MNHVRSAQTHACTRAPAQASSIDVAVDYPLKPRPGGASSALQSVPTLRPSISVRPHSALKAGPRYQICPFDVGIDLHRPSGAVTPSQRHEAAHKITSREPLRGKHAAVTHRHEEQIEELSRTHRELPNPIPRHYEPCGEASTLPAPLVSVVMQGGENPWVLPLLLPPLPLAQIHSVLNSALKHAVRKEEIPCNVACNVRSGTPRPHRGSARAPGRQRSPVAAIVRTRSARWALQGRTSRPSRRAPDYPLPRPPTLDRHPAPGARRRSRRHQGTPRPRPHRRHRRRLRPRPTPPPTPSHRRPQRRTRHGQRRPRRPALRGKRPLTLPSPLPSNDREPPPSTRLVGAPILYADPNSGSRSDRHLMALPRGRKARRSLLCQVMPSVAATSSTLQLSPPRIRHDESGKEDAECLHVLSLRKTNNLSHLLE